VQLHRHRKEFEEAGARLAVIGQGSPRHAEHFIEEYELEGMQVLVDPDRKTYEAAGAKIATVDELVHPRIVARGVELSTRERLVQGRTQGHSAQLGGVLVVARDGRVAWAKMADDASESPPVEDVLKAARAAADTG
jgi:peroxiredoxin